MSDKLSLTNKDIKIKGVKQYMPWETYNDL